MIRSAGALAAVREAHAIARRITLPPRDRAASHSSGAWPSRLLGRGLEFEELRDYEAEDDVRAIDWNVTARLGRPVVRRAAQEGVHPLLLIVDGSASLGAGGGFDVPASTAARLAVALVLAAASAGDPVGLILVTDVIENECQPTGARARLRRTISTLARWRASGCGTRLSVGLSRANRMTSRTSLVVLISDFQTDEKDDPLLAPALRHCAARHEVVPVWLRPRAVATMPDVGMIALGDPERGQTRVLDTHRSSSRDRCVSARTAHDDRISSMFRDCGVAPLAIDASADPAAALMAHLDRRGRRTR